MLPRELPDPVPPAPHQLVASYLDRLAALHGVSSYSLWKQVTDPAESNPAGLPAIPERLAALTGRSAHALAGALPELREPEPDWVMFRHLPQVGCHHCDARHPGGRVVRLLPHHRYACVRHQVWIGPLDIDRPADVSKIPEITKAQKRHLRTVHRFGWNAAHDGLITAFVFCAQLWAEIHRRSDQRHVGRLWDSRTDLLIQPDKIWATYSTSKLFAVVFPEAVRIAPLFASPYWRKTAGSSEDSRLRFHSELIDRIGYLHETDQAVELIDRWAIGRALQPLRKPRLTYTPGRKRITTAHLTLNRGRRHGKSAHWFAKKRQAGITILWHSHIKSAFELGWIQ